MNELIIIKQLPIIEEQLKTISAEIDEKLALVDTLVCSEDTVKDVKKIRAEFNKDFEQLETQRKTVKTAIMTPYDQFEAIYKEYVSNKYTAADKILKEKIGVVEDELRTRKLEQVTEYFDEYAAANNVSDYADFKKQMSDLTRTSYSMKEFQRICRERIDPLVSGLKAIESIPEESRAEVLAEFKRTLKASEAMSIVAERHKAIDAAKAAQAEREARQAVEAEAVERVEQVIAPPLSPPVQEAAEPVVAVDDPVLTVKFSVTAKRSKLKELKAFLTEGGYQLD